MHDVGLVPHEIQRHDCHGEPQDPTQPPVADIAPRQPQGKPQRGHLEAHQQALPIETEHHSHQAACIVRRRSAAAGNDTQQVGHILHKDLPVPQSHHHADDSENPGCGTCQECDALAPALTPRALIIKMSDKRHHRQPNGQHVGDAGKRIHAHQHASQQQGTPSAVREALEHAR